MGHIPSSETNSLWGSKKIPGWYCSWMFITLQDSPPCVPLRSQSFYPTSMSILKLTCLLHLVLTRDLFLSAFLTNRIHLFLLPSDKAPPPYFIQLSWSRKQYLVRNTKNQAPISQCSPTLSYFLLLRLTLSPKELVLEHLNAFLFSFCETGFALHETYTF